MTPGKRKGLINLLIVLAAAAVAFHAGLRVAGPIRVECASPTRTMLDQGAAGSIGDGPACELSWVICWRRT